MTVTKALEFTVSADPVRVRSAARALTARGGKYLLVADSNGSFVLRRRRGQDARFTVSFGDTATGCQVSAICESPPYVKADLFGGYGLWLAELRTDLESAVRSGARDDSEREIAEESGRDNRSLTQFALGIPVLGRAGDSRGATAVRLLLLALFAAGVVLSPAFVSHLAWLGAWAVAVAAVGAVDRWLALRQRRH